MAMSESACPHCRGSRAEVLVGRRTVLGAMLAGPALAAPGWAQDLLDPTALRGARVSSPTDLGPRQRPADRTSPSYARDMEASITSALLSLVRAYGSVADQIGKLTAKEKDLAARLAAAIRDKEAKLDEYRQGLFCSGCGKTRSEILSRGEQFPHPGQHIIQATPEQIAAKERELQGIIDRLAAELKAVRDELAKGNPDIDAIKSQLFEGMSLWRTAVSFHGRLLRQQDLDDQDAYLRERARISAQLKAIPEDGARQTSSGGVQRAASTLGSWISTLQQVETRRGSERRAYDQALTAADTLARREVASVQAEADAVAARITAFGLAGYLKILTTIMSPTVAPTGPGEVSGYMFRMGKYDRAGMGEILPNVAAFLAKAQGTALIFPNGSAPPADQELRQAEGNRGKLQALATQMQALEAQRQREAEARARQEQQDAMTKVPGA
jgi:predicted Fe-S protein YdhL (DUF1289 family)